MPISIDRVYNTKTKKVKLLRKSVGWRKYVVLECPECGRDFLVPAGRYLGDWVEYEGRKTPVPICPDCALGFERGKQNGKRKS